MLNHIISYLTCWIEPKRKQHRADEDHHFSAPFRHLPPMSWFQARRKIAFILRSFALVNALWRLEIWRWNPKHFFDPRDVKKINHDASRLPSGFIKHGNGNRHYSYIYIYHSYIIYVYIYIYCLYVYMYIYIYLQVIFPDRNSHFEWISQPRFMMTGGDLGPGTPPRPRPKAPPVEK